MGRFSTDLLKRFIAPRIDEPVKVSLPDLSIEMGQSTAWMQSYFLSSLLHGEFNGESRLYAESIIARVQITFSQYQSARLKTIDYANQWKLGSPGIGRYLAAVGEWESVFINLQTIYDLLAKFFGMKLSADGAERRSWIIANRIKHSSEDIRDGKLTNSGMPLWLTPEGFATITAEVTYDEMVSEVRILSKIASCLSVPTEASQRFKALGAELKDDPNYEATP